jgi:ribosomal protein S18 acetylase RimI-like enzyme
MEATAIAVRTATADDAGALAEIHVEAWRIAYRGLFPQAEIESIRVEQRRQFWKGMLSRAGASKVDLAEDEAGVIAFCSYGPTRDADTAGSAEIYALYAHPEKWRRGAGRRLCERAIGEAINRAHSVMTLWVVKGNEAACRFYERLGFAADGAQRRNTRLLATPFDEIRYRKAIA